MKRTAPLSRIVLAVLAASMGVAPVIAFQATTTAHRFDRKVIHDPSATLNSAPLSVKEMTVNTALRSGWDLFASQYGDKWDITVDGRSGVPMLVQGEGIPWVAGSGNSLQDAAAVTVDALDHSIKTFMRTNAVVFATDTDEMVLSRAGSGQMNKDLWAVTYQRQVGGVPVAGDTYVFYVGHGNLITFGANRWGHISTSPVPSLPASEAFGHLTNYMGLTDKETLTVLDAGSLQFTPVAAGGSSESVYEGPVGGGYDAALTYKISFRVGDEAPTWVGLVDAHSGKILALYDDNDYAQVKGGVLPLSNDGVCPSGCEQPNYPMPYADITINGGGAPAANGAGIFSCVPIGGTAVTTLNGTYIKVVDACGAITRSSTCANDIDLGVNAGTDCAVPAGASAGDTRSSRTGFFHLNRIKENARAYLPGNAWLNAQLTDNVNINLTCNAFWNGSTVNFYRSGGGCRNTGEISAVFLHEWGHGMSANDGGGSSNPDEAYADISSLLVTHASCIGRGFLADDSNCDGYGNACLACSGIRDQDWDKRANHAPSTPEGFIATCGGGGGPCGKEVHCEGYLIGETLFDLATRDLPGAGLDTNSAWQLANKLWYVSRLGTSGAMYGCGAPANTRGCAATTVMQQLRVTDDDDGNLANGTPHAAAIFSAFNRHNITCGAAGDAANQNTSSCPAIAAPTVTTTAGSGSIQLNWSAVAGASSYKILRNDAGCGSGYQIIATVAAPTTTYTDNGLANGFTEYYSVQAVGANQACEGPMGACVTGTPQPCAGSVTLNKQIFSCADNIQISLVDGDLVGAGTYNVAASSTTETTPETVTLIETPANSGIFVGNITTTSAPPSANGQLSVANGNTILVRYVDVSYCGTPNVNVDGTASADCLGPVITNVHQTNVTGNSATILWDTNESSSSSVTYAPAPGPPGTTPPPDPALVQSHSFNITGLAACSPYVYQVGSTDIAGNTASNNNGGAYYSFTTGVNVQPTYTYSGAPVAIPDNNPTGASAIISVPDNKAILDLNVTIGSLTHSYDNDIVVHVIGPDNTDIILSNRRGSDGDNFTNTVFDDAAATAISAGTAPFTGTFRPDGALSAFNGKIAAGNWKLFVVDQANADTGNIVSWSLTFTYPAQQCGPSLAFSSSSKTDACGAGGPGNNNGVADPGEDISLPVKVKNNGTGLVTGITGVLTTSTPGVTITSNTAAYPDLNADASAQGSPAYSFTVDDDVPCLTNVNFQIAMHGNEGSWNDNFSVQVGATTPPTTTYNSTDVPKTIADMTTVNSVRNVADIYPITDVDVGVNITHSYDGDVVILLVPPGSAPITLVNRQGLGGDNFTNTVFDDSAATSITAGTPPYTGSFRPESSLAVLNGTMSNGTWTLRVADQANLDSGTLTAWFVRLTTNPLPSCANCSLGTPGEAGVGNLRWQLPSSKTVIQWGAAANASFYNVYRGTGATLPNLLNANNDSCLLGSTPSLSLSGLSSSPPAGTTWWYLVRGANGHSEGPAGNATAGPEVLNSSGGCP